MTVAVQKDKWEQYGVLRAGPPLDARLPETRLLEKDALSNMLQRHPSVVLKPRDGSFGTNIIFIQRTETGAYRMQHENNAITMSGTDEVLEWLWIESKGRGYIVQERIRLARIGRRPFDIRVMVQRKKAASSPWTVTGSYAKVAAKGYLVTNVASRPIPLLRALKSARIEDRSLPAKVARAALEAAERLGERYPDLRQVGFDIGIDRERRIWIIEGNYQPALRPFRLLKDSTMLRRIHWYRNH
ncbi:YheC/YheD family protein [Paenibacillus sp. FSL W8-1187]|uniref:YheC/YheD family protein n=1 Tax=Paenibacillus sp. FSL W8-1187 TaxID=2975339 RepID=UPI0030DCC57F